MADQELTNLLASLVRANATRKLSSATGGPTPQVSGLAQSILSRVPVQNPYKSVQEPLNDPRGPSVVNRVLDVLSRPLYGVMTPLKKELEENAEQIKSGDFLGAVRSGADLLSPISQAGNIWAGLSGKEKTTGRDILEATPATDNLPGPVKFGAGLALDIGLDPLTYVGVGLAPKLGRTAKTSTEALASVAESTGKSAQNIAQDISRRAAQQSTDLAETVPVKGMPAPPIGSPPRLFKAGPGPIGGLENLIRSEKTTVPLPPVLPRKRATLALPAAPAKVKTPFDEVQELNQQILSARSPVAKALLRKQVEKLNAGVEPADVLRSVRVNPTEFPEITINERWMAEAKDAALKFLKSNRNKNINHIGQTNLYNRILNSASKVRKDRRAFHVFQMLRVAENHILNSGRKLTDAEGISVRLSDLANTMGGPRALNSKLIDDFRRARPSQQIEDFRSHAVVKKAEEVLDPVVTTAQKLEPELKQIPPSQTVLVGSEISKALTNLAKSAGASSKEANSAKAFIDDLFTVDRDQLYSKIEQEARNLVRQSSSGKINPASMHKISEEVYKSLGANPKVLGKDLTQSKVVEGIMTKFATWWNAKDLKPFSREYIDTARNVAAAFSEALTPLVRSTTPTQRQTAWSIASGKLSAGTVEEQRLADQLRQLTERLLGTHGITENAESVLLRSGTLMKEINKELPDTLKFINKKGTDDLGRSFDYSNGDWMHSWKEWKVEEPAEALYQLTRALQLVTRKNSMWDDAATRWGMPVKEGEYQFRTTGIPRLENTFFPKEIAQQLTSLQGQLERDIFRSPHKAIDLFDKVQRMWKTGVTIYSPSHHVRNLNGDVYLAALDGVISPKPYKTAAKILHAYSGRYKDLESVFNIMDPNLREAALKARPGNVVVITKRGETLTAEQVYQAAEAQGLLARALHAEDLVGQGSPALGTFGSKFKPLGGKAYGAATKVSEMRDHWARLAHFVDVLEKSKEPLPVAIKNAGLRVKKFHPDGMDLTGFEQNVLRRIIPFYSWMRKATPLVLEGALMRPHVTMAFPKVMANMQLATGIESEGPGNPFPVDQLFPDWLKEKGVGPIFQEGASLSRSNTWQGSTPGDTIVNPTNPFIDQIAQLGSPGKTLLSSLSPGARIPIELLTGQTTLGIPLEAIEGGTPGYLSQQIPAVGTATRLTGLNRDNEPWSPEQLINYLTGLGVTGTGPYQEQASIEIRQMLEALAKKNAGDYR